MLKIPEYNHFRVVNKIKHSPMRTPIISETPARENQKCWNCSIAIYFINSEFTSNNCIDFQMFPTERPNVQQHSIVDDNVNGPAQVDAHHVPHRLFALPQWPPASRWRIILDLMRLLLQQLLNVVRHQMHSIIAFGRFDEDFLRLFDATVQQKPSGRIGYPTLLWYCSIMIGNEFFFFFFFLTATRRCKQWWDRKWPCKCDSNCGRNWPVRAVWWRLPTRTIRSMLRLLFAVCQMSNRKLYWEEQYKNIWKG